jgi:2-phosphosulfolactate phosphatase
MQIEISEFEEGARQARGLTVIIDVFRAFSVECYAVDSGASRIIATGDPEEAFRLREKYPSALLAGERNERKIPGFDFGNSPTEIIKSDLNGKTFIHTTTAGTAGLVNAVNADILISGSLVNASAVARYIYERKPGRVSLVAMGYRATIPAEEDLLCAEYIKSMIEGRNEDFDDRIAALRHTAGKRFFANENIDFSPPTDFFLCIMKDRFDFVLRAERRNDGNMNMIRTDF